MCVNDQETEGYKLRCDNTSPHASTEGGNSLLPFICKYIETGMFIDRAQYRVTKLQIPVNEMDQPIVLPQIQLHSREKSTFRSECCSVGVKSL